MSLNPQAPEFIPNNYHINLPMIPLSWCYSLAPDRTLQSYFPTMIPSATPTKYEPMKQEQLKNDAVLGPVDSIDNNDVAVDVAAPGGGAEKKRFLSGGIRRSRSFFISRTKEGGGYYAWREKGSSAYGGDEHDDDENNRRYYRDPIRNREIVKKNKKKKHDILPVREEGQETTVMIKNIPAKYSRDNLVEFLDNHCMIENRKVDEGEKDDEKDKTVLAFDFVYLPIDFRTGWNKGYAFVNFTSPMAAWRFNLTASNGKWDLFQSNKKREVVSARLQGKEKLQKHFETMNFPCHYEEVLPVFYSPPRDGATKPEPRTVGKLLRRCNQL